MYRTRDDAHKNCPADFDQDCTVVVPENFHQRQEMPSIYYSNDNYIDAISKAMLTTLLIPNHYSAVYIIYNIHIYIQCNKWLPLLGASRAAWQQPTT